MPPDELLFEIVWEPGSLGGAAQTVVDVLRLVNRIIVIANHQIVMDGPRDAVLQRLSAGRNPGASTAAAPAPNAQGVAS